MTDLTNDWTKPDGELGRWMAAEVLKTLNSYREQPRRVEEDARTEDAIAGGGYARRQLFELVQNSADALSTTNGGRIVVRLAGDFLYCADEGGPIDRDGITALMFSRMSRKRGTSQIGMFGVGFKSMLGVSDTPEFFSRSVSFRFDPARARERIHEVVPTAEHCPTLRLPEPIDPAAFRDKDSVLNDLMEWAVNIVRLPIRDDGARANLSMQMKQFPPEWPLIVEHVETLELADDHDKSRRKLARKPMGRDDSGSKAVRTASPADRHERDRARLARSWKLFRWTHTLSSEAKADRSPGNEREVVTISWAVPLNRLTDPGKFWAFFPTHTASLVAGILNAPWKTNEDRLNLLPGPYNEELIEAAAVGVARRLPKLMTGDDPARHLDALPRREESGDSDEANLLRRRLFSHLRNQKIVPDQDGNLLAPADVQYPPQLPMSGQVETETFKRWAAYPNRPRAWLHHKALSRNRLAVIDRLFAAKSVAEQKAPRATIAEWLEALLEAGDRAHDLVQASMAAIQSAALLSGCFGAASDLGKIVGKIVLVADDTRVRPNPEQVFLPNDADGNSQTGADVHPTLMADRDTVSALKKLGLTRRSPEAAFRRVATRIRSAESYGGQANEEQWSRFWRLSRRMSVEKAQAVVRDVGLAGRIRVRTLAGKWKHVACVLIPGNIVSRENGRDREVTADVVGFHQADMSLMQKLEVVKTPQEQRDLSLEREFKAFRDSQRRKYRDRDDLPKTPQSRFLRFSSVEGVGPLDVLASLSDEGRVLYTKALLECDACYTEWTMEPTGRAGYPAMRCESLTVHMLKKHGRLRIGSRIVPLKDALGAQPDPTALNTLLRHSRADKIKQAFGLAEPTPEFVDPEDPIPLVDEWPGLSQHLQPHQRAWQLIRCRQILVGGEKRECIRHNSIVYLARSTSSNVDNERHVSLVAKALGIQDRRVAAILEYNAPEDVARRRAEVKELATDEERLLKAVGEEEMCDQLPVSLVAALEDGEPSLRGRRMAEAAIAIWHTDALRQYRGAVRHLDPPSRWAGSPRAVNFVRSLGFSPAWAGERKRRRDPFLEVEGPQFLPEFHPYQRRIADNVRKLLRGESAKRHGLISLPTGSGKTRVAVQAIVEAVCDDGFSGGVLWVADRDELCEQAVVAWRQVWSCKGLRATRLRISRMWAGQPRPLPTNELHVVVATIQSLNAKLANQPSEYRFLTKFTLVVFDEAHRSIASSYTKVMEEIGLTHLGLTATPYRNDDTGETKRLSERYDQNRLDWDVFTSNKAEEVVQELQDMQVLAQMKHAEIHGATLSASAVSDEEWKKIHSDLKQASELPWLPQSVEDFFARNRDRTKRIIDAYFRHVEPEWPTLIFATSVEHAQTVTALLQFKGVPSRADSGRTEPATRRRVVECFRSGEIKALVNYGVFREGFDAPKTRAIIVARPVYSRNLYFQMIGRGLRGPKHGGGKECLILNVRDNIQNFHRRLAYSDLDGLWQ